MDKNVKLGVVGCGKMASAILSGAFKKHFLKADDVYLYDTNIENSGKLSKEFGFNEAFSLKNLTENCDVILLAVKPYLYSEILSELKEYYNNQLVLTILAGVRIKKYKSIINNIKLVRIMPNTPALVGLGASAIVVDKDNSNDEIDFAYNLMQSCGEVVKTTEDKIDIITALSGSGPAFYFKIIELMAKSAVKLGLNKDEAMILSTQTALGSAKMILENNFNIEKLIKDVTTPGGCTEVGNEILADSMIGDILDKTIFETMLKAKELG